MNKKLLIATTTLLLLTGCGSTTTETDGSSVQPGSSVTSSETKTQYDEAYFANLIKDYPVAVQGCTDLSTPKEYSLTMSGCTAENIIKIDLKETYITASGILTNGIDSTAADIFVAYNISKNDDGSYQVLSSACTDETLYLTPAIPFSMELLYENISAVYVYPKGNIADYTDYPISDFTIELDPECWKNNYRYGGTIYLTDKEGNKYINNTYWAFSYEKGEWKIRDIVKAEKIDSEQ